uniref:BY PROTMAP: gi/647398086/emb/CDR41713.1/ RHTO0S06e04698g1_1 [Rhodosporidium toruloides] n=1 Tax=Rhodotorula toruloides TaxID=5286 RepID=A0A0K3CFS4_RHOTO
MRRIVVCCDGTWESALFQTNERMITNVGRIMTAIERTDSRGVEQIKMYFPGLGTGEQVFEAAWQGAFGDGLLTEVRQAYYFIAQNWAVGDEILLFGFSRGAYVCRLLTTLISLIGILDPKSTLSSFPLLFDLLCQHRDPAMKRGRRAATALAKEMDKIAAFRQEQLLKMEGKAYITVLGLFDTVPLYHFHSTSKAGAQLHLSPFSTHNEQLEGPDVVSHVFQALSLNEHRQAYAPVILVQGNEGKKAGQVLRQAGSVLTFDLCADLGGGYSKHDLALLSLHWLVSEIQEHIALDLDLLLRDATDGSAAAPWGSLAPYTPLHVAPPHDRPFPTPTSPASSATNQFLHPSILQQDPQYLPSRLRLELGGPIMRAEARWWKLDAWEEKVRKEWKYGKKAPGRRAAGLSPSPFALNMRTTKAAVYRSQQEAAGDDPRHGVIRYLEHKLYNAGNASSLAGAR